MKAFQLVKTKLMAWHANLNKHFVMFNLANFWVFHMNAFVGDSFEDVYEDWKLIFTKTLSLQQSQQPSIKV